MDLGAKSKNGMINVYIHGLSDDLGVEATDQAKDWLSKVADELAGEALSISDELQAFGCAVREIPNGPNS